LYKEKKLKKCHQTNYRSEKWIMSDQLNDDGTAYTVFV
jgi:hypothetical protein